MKLPLIHLILICLCSPVIAENAESRKWTDAKSGKAISGVIVDKKPDHSAALIRLPNGKTHWIKASRLINTDQDFIKKWEKPFHFITFKVIRDKDKLPISLQVTFNSGKQDTAVLVDPTKPQSGNTISFITYKLKANESKVFELKCDQEYKITVYNTTGQKLFETIRKPEHNK